ncbi:unnamed protein product [Brassica oleracea var. botrytis]
MEWILLLVNIFHVRVVHLLQVPILILAKNLISTLPLINSSIYSRCIAFPCAILISNIRRCLL